MIRIFLARFSNRFVTLLRRIPSRVFNPASRIAGSDSEHATSGLQRLAQIISPALRRILHHVTGIGVGMLQLETYPALLTALRHAFPHLVDSIVERIQPGVDKGMGYIKGFSIAIVVLYYVPLRVVWARILPGSDRERLVTHLADLSTAVVLLYYTPPAPLAFSIGRIQFGLRKAAHGIMYLTWLTAPITFLWGIYLSPIPSSIASYGRSWARSGVNWYRSMRPYHRVIMSLDAEASHENRDGQRFLRALLRARGDANSRDGNGVTVLRQAVDNQQADVVEALLDAKADPNVGDYSDSYLFNNLPLEVALRFRDYYSYPIIQALLNAKADPNVGGRRILGGTPLHAAVLRGRVDRGDNTVQALINAKADVNKKDDNGRLTPLMLAAELGSEDNVRALLEAKADVSITTGRDESEFNALDLCLKKLKDAKDTSFAPRPFWRQEEDEKRYTRVAEQLRGAEEKYFEAVVGEGLFDKLKKIPTGNNKKKGGALTNIVLDYMGRGRDLLSTR